MAAQSTLRSPREIVKQFTRAYASKRPVIQRILTIGFILYTIFSSYQGLSGKATSPQTNKKGKGKDVADQKSSSTGKHGRVAVRSVCPPESLIEYLATGRCYLL